MLDLTRLVSRAGKMPTGVDRVERAYLRHLLLLSEPVFGVIRTTLGFVLLDRAGLVALSDRFDGNTPWGAPDFWSRLARSKSRTVRCAESDLRRLALDRCRPRALIRMLARHLPDATAYLNVGHSNLTERMLTAVRKGVDGTIAVMIHDTIPLDLPQFQRPGTPERFAGMLRRVCQHADLVIYNSADTQRAAERHMSATDTPPTGVVAHLGVPVPQSVPGDIPAGLDLSQPYFVTVGTIEPRKRHDLLLDVWQDMEGSRSPSDMPGLLICGARGWNNDAVFRRLDALPSNGSIRELPGLSDGAVAALVQGSCGLLFPSVAEGYGLPPIEASAIGVPVICHDLPVYREILSDIPVYAGETDRYQWRNIVESLIKGRIQENKAVSEQMFTPPTWDEHFNTVLRLT